jgi:hypothetical protein
VCKKTGSVQEERGLRMEEWYLISEPLYPRTFCTETPELYFHSIPLNSLINVAEILQGF